MSWGVVVQVLCLGGVRDDVLGRGRPGAVPSCSSLPGQLIALLQGWGLLWASPPPAQGIPQKPPCLEDGHSPCLLTQPPSPCHNTPKC